MTIGSDNLSNGSATAQDRFSGGVSAYRQTRREAALAAEHSDGELISRRDNSSLPTRSPGMSGSVSQALEPTSALDRAAKLPSLDMHGLTEPVFSPQGWSDSGSQSMADHPLLRGLLLELPARGTMPASDWLDRWFEAARSILELLYVQEARTK
jgi:hypothetical protein